MLGVENLLNCNQVVGMFKLILRGIVVGHNGTICVGSGLGNAVTVNFTQIALDCNRICEAEVHCAASLTEEKYCTVDECL
ncbi:hypothetical protein GCM10011282_29000 [Undibacterium macrobrachii]|uniref:Uncharacterized protein n=1 Tax=Undibacterium macrobrachii TaxID=1119058 RepID=A0ABQ2XJR5_9BURK|nr:hypothetical protein GCM10011282_29000 [Undibacterium macrobrachii]